MWTMLGWFNAEAAFASLALGRQNLDRNGPVEMRVSGFVYHAHAALTELGFDPIMAEGLADH